MGKCLVTLVTFFSYLQHSNEKFNEVVAQLKDKVMSLKDP